MSRWALLLLTVCPLMSAVAETRALVVAGLGGTDDYELEFQRLAKQGADRLRAVADDVTLLLGEMVTRERVRRELAALAGRAAAADSLVVMLIGHGSFDDRDYRFNVPGPDFTGAELADWLQALPARRQLVVAATSSSGALQPLLADDGRTVITATRSGSERNASGFAGYFIEALGEARADLDKDGYLSAAEAFAYAENRVAAYYAERDRVATEHPLTHGPEATATLARLAHAPAPPSDDAAQNQRVADLEAAIEALRADRDSRETDVYYAELQRLLLELAMARRGPAGEGAP